MEPQMLQWVEFYINLFFPQPIFLLISFIHSRHFSDETAEASRLHEMLGYGIGCFQGLSNFALNGMSSCFCLLHFIKNLTTQLLPSFWRYNMYGHFDDLQKTINRKSGTFRVCQQNSMQRIS